MKHKITDAHKCDISEKCPDWLKSNNYKDDESNTIIVKPNDDEFSMEYEVLRSYDCKFNSYQKTVFAKKIKTDQIYKFVFSKNTDLPIKGVAITKQLISEIGK